MIFVTVGSQKFQMNRLLEAIDMLLEKQVIQEEVFVQSGWSTYRPKNYQYRQFIDQDEMNRYFNDAELIICHSGSSSINTALKVGKKVIIVPRKAEFGEHVDDHQFELASAFEKMGYVLVAREVSELADKIEQAKLFKPNSFQSHTQDVVNIIIQAIERR